MAYTGGGGGPKRVPEEGYLTLAPPVASQRRRVPPTPAAIHFLLTVRRAFASNPAKFQQFVAVLVDYLHGRIDTVGVVRRMQIVLQGHPYLIRGFNTFLPRGYAIWEEYGGAAGHA